MKRLFHLVPTAQWAEFLASERREWAPPSLESEGFIHFSLAEQVQGSLDRHFAGQSAVTLLEIDPESVAGQLKMEPSRGGADFPHLFRAMRREEVVGSWKLTAPFSVPAEII